MGVFNGSINGCTDGCIEGCVEGRVGGDEEEFLHFSIQDSNLISVSLSDFSLNLSDSNSNRDRVNRV